MWSFAKNRSKVTIPFGHLHVPPFHLFQNSHRQTAQIEVESFDIPQDTSGLCSTRSGPLCNSPVYPVPTLLHLAAKSICRSNWCIPPSVDLHQDPPWNLVGRILTQVQTRKSTIVLMSPVWKSHPILLHMLVDHLKLIATEMETMVVADLGGCWGGWSIPFPCHLMKYKNLYAV